MSHPTYNCTDSLQSCIFRKSHLPYFLISVLHSTCILFSRTHFCCLNSPFLHCFTCSCLSGVGKIHNFYFFRQNSNSFLSKSYPVIRLVMFDSVTLKTCSAICQPHLQIFFIICRKKISPSFTIIVLLVLTVHTK